MFIGGLFHRKPPRVGLSLLSEGLSEFELFAERGATEKFDLVYSYCSVRAVVLQS